MNFRELHKKYLSSDRVKVAAAKIKFPRCMTKLGKAGSINISRIGTGILSSRTRTFTCWSPLPERKEWWRSSDWRQIDTEARLLAVAFNSKISKENFHVQASPFHFVFPYGMLIAQQSYFSSCEEWRQAGHCYQKRMVFRANDQIKKLLREIQSLFPGKN